MERDYDAETLAAWNGFHLWADLGGYDDDADGLLSDIETLAAGSFDTRVRERVRIAAAKLRERLREYADTRERAPVGRLFIGVYPEGLVYADRSRERAGDYVRCAFLSYRTLALEFERDCPAALRPLIERDAAAIQARRGEDFQISTAGQTVKLGGC